MVYIYLIVQYIIVIHAIYSYLSYKHITRGHIDICIGTILPLHEVYCTNYPSIMALLIP